MKLVCIYFLFYFSVAEHLTAQHSAIKMLHSRVKVVLDYVKAVESGALPGESQDSHMKHHEILREAYSLSHWLPVLQTPQFTTDLYNVSIVNSR